MASSREDSVRITLPTSDGAAAAAGDVYLPEPKGFRPHQRGLPPLSSWGHRPLLFRVDPKVPVTCEGGVNLPLNHGRPTPFESALFVGEVLFRIRNVPNSATDPWAPGHQYPGKKRAMAFVVQGKFKRRLSYADVRSGFECGRPLTVQWYAKPALSACLSACKFVQPGLESDIHGPKPYVQNVLAASCDTFTETPAGRTPPPIMGGEPPEVGPWEDKKARRLALKNESSRKENYFEPGNTYTFGFHSDKMLFLDFKAKLPLGREMNLESYLNGQPFPFLARTTKGDILWKFELWHESLLAKAGEGIMERQGLGVGGLSSMITRRRSVRQSNLGESGTLRRLGSLKSIRREESEEGLSDDDNDADVSDDVKTVRRRLREAEREQFIMRAQMDTLLRSGVEPLSQTSQAHADFAAAVTKMCDTVAGEMGEFKYKAFDTGTTHRYLQLMAKQVANAVEERSAE